MQDLVCEINICRGIRNGGCPHALAVLPELSGDIGGAVQASDWPQACLAGSKGAPKAHHQLRISAAGCPNGCSRPPIADIGLIRALRPQFRSALCTGCGRCPEVCREGAITVTSAGVHIDPEACLQCGACTRVCPEGALEEGHSGWRVLVGGRLGRHPQLALELPGLFSETQMLELLTATAAWWARHWQPGLRLGGKRAALCAALVQEGHIAEDVFPLFEKGAVCSPQ